MWPGTSGRTTNPDSVSTPPSAPTAAASGQAASLAGRILPSSSEVGRVQSSDSESEEFTIPQTDVIAEAFGHVKCLDALIYVHGGDSNGVLAAASSDTYLGRTRKFLTEVRVVGEQNLPFLIPETGKSELQPARTYVRGAAGTKLLLVYRR